jgi:hypothetical protein
MDMCPKRRFVICLLKFKCRNSKGGRNAFDFRLWYSLLSITNKMQRYTILFIMVNALHVPGGFSAHHQELKTVHKTFTHANGSSKQA